MQPPVEGEDLDAPAIPVVHTVGEILHPEYDPRKTRLPKFSPEELLGLTYLHDTPDGQRVHAEIVKHINDFDGQNHQNIKFVNEYGEPKYEEIISYRELSDIG